MRNIDLFHPLIDIAIFVIEHGDAAVFQQPFQRVLSHLTSVILSTNDRELFDLLTESLELFNRLSLIDEELIQKLNATVFPCPTVCEDNDTAFDGIEPEEIEDDSEDINVNDLSKKDWIDIKDLDPSKIYITNPELIRIFNELKAKRA
jgi:hypothetical protein